MTTEPEPEKKSEKPANKRSVLDAFDDVKENLDDFFDDLEDAFDEFW